MARGGVEVGAGDITRDSAADRLDPRRHPPQHRSRRAADRPIGGTMTGTSLRALKLAAAASLALGLAACGDDADDDPPAEPAAVEEPAVVDEPEPAADEPEPGDDGDVSEEPAADEPEEEAGPAPVNEPSRFNPEDI
ncbi:MAG: hypothetical protein KIS96_10605 [Bauldia sp.]|nr:hypothetical protein [Bauldia sp.]